MTRLGFLNSTTTQDYEGDTELFQFDIADTYLKVLPEIRFTRDLAEIERVKILLSDNRQIENIFIAFKMYWYYFQKEWYYSGHSGHISEIPKPPENILEAFDFRFSDIDYVISTNKLELPKFDWFQKIAPFPGDPRTSGKSIRKNILVKESVIKKEFIKSILKTEIIYQK